MTVCERDRNIPSQPPAQLATSTGALAAELLRANEFRAESGTVVGAFSSGCHLRFGDDVIAVGAIPPGPLHVALQSPVPGIDERATCTIGEGRITIDGFGIDMNNVKEWAPEVPNRCAMAAFVGVIAHLEPELVAVPDLSSVWTEVVTSLEVGDFATTTALLQGRGMGLTPTGDDVIAGVLLFDAWMNPDHEYEELRRAHARAIRSTDLSRAFLRWAAKGQSIEPVHQLIEHASSHDRERFKETARLIAQIGSSSGRALMAGLQQASRQLPRTLTGASHSWRGDRPSGILL